MSLTTITALEALSSMASYSAVIDARSPSEYALDRLPDARNWPSLNDEERARVGTIYKQESAFEARKIGGALVARNVSNHILAHCQDKDKNWKPLIYCWRGGKRSGSLALILGQIGFDVHLIEGGYKAFRAEMLKDLDRLATQFDYRVVCAPTGSGKTRLLHALQAQGAQVLDLEDLANHRSSVLGLVPGQVQPSQKQYDMRIWQALKTFDPARPVFVESESKKVGNVSIPECLISAIRAGRCLRLDLPLQARVALLLEDYDYFVKDAEFFCKRLDVLVPLRGRSVVEAWQQQAYAGQMNAVVEDLLTYHYDPSYLSSMQRNFTHYESAKVYALNAHSHPVFAALAQDLLANL
ncbi:MAG: tRNA 2-selenouridine(34) synthase MnmH [Cytophagales bacterium]|nr:tRNA 2-selenouridine(34) synthase MnmH [Cytophagales bacterium]